MEPELRRVDLLGADLREADVRLAYLTGTEVIAQQLAQAASLEGATLPDGTVHEEAWRREGALRSLGAVVGGWWRQGHSP